MGILTLEDFRDSVKHALGGVGVGNLRIDRWVNLGVQETAAQFLFNTLLASGQVVTVADTESYALPAQTLGLHVVWIEAEKKRLLPVSLIELRRRQLETNGTPEVFATDRVRVYFNPIPDAVYTIDYIRRRESVTLAAPADPTEFPAGWDAVVDAFSKYYALQSMGRNNEARNWFIRGTNLGATRMKDMEYEFESPSRGVQVGWDESDVVDQV